MKPVINLEEKIGKMVGKIPERTPAEAIDRLVRQFNGMGLKLPYPKGGVSVQNLRRSRRMGMETHDGGGEEKISRPAESRDLNRLCAELNRQGAHYVVDPPEGDAAKDVVTRAWRRLKAWWTGSRPA